MIEYGRAHFTGTPVARCTECEYLSVYWETPEDHDHECPGNTETLWRVAYQTDSTGPRNHGIQICTSLDEARTVAASIVGQQIRPVDVYDHPQQVLAAWIEHFDCNEWRQTQ